MYLKKIFIKSGMILPHTHIIMKKILPLFLSVLALNFGYAQQRSCGTMDHLHQLNQSHPRSDDQMQKIEQHTNHFIQQVSSSQARAAETVISIPVVVHVVYGSSGQNISDAQIQSQIQVLNEDFRRLNSDASNTPSAFASIAADIQVEFCMASIDPNGNATNGITRTSTNSSSFGTNDYVKYDQYGGKNAWATDKYLNLWVCNMAGSTLGYAQFPGSGSAATDGVVISYKYFGRGGSAQAPFNKGRTATHEVGHWLNLRHIWGDGGCSYDDYVNDTPLAGNEHYGCPSWPTSTCSSNDMYMNYMDYVDDACMNLFTTGQKNRMRALFASGGFRESLLSSQACGSGTGNNPSYCATNGKDASYEWIAGVQVGTLNHTSGTDGGYKDNTSISVNMNTGGTYNVNLTPGFASGTYNEYWKIWIDYNQDMDFDDAGELAFDAGSMSTAAVSGNITVPSGATAGATRMRVSMKYNAAQTACESFGYGEVEDYTVNISTVTPCNTPTGLSASNITHNSATTNWSSVSGAVNYTLEYKATSSSIWINAGSATLTGLSPNTNYEWRIRTNCSSANSAYSSSQSFATISEPCNIPSNVNSSSITTNSASATWTAVSNAASYSFSYRVSGSSTWTNSTVSTNSKSLTGLSSATTYEYKVRTNCSTTSSNYSSTLNFTTEDDTPVQTGYCTSAGTNSSYEWIANVTVGALNNSTGTNGGYADFTSTELDVEKGSSYAVSLSPGFSGSTYEEYWKIWIDYNQDGDFSDAGELVYDAGSMSTATVSGSIAIPSTVSTGRTRMRVSMKYNGAQTECETFEYGEVEDYTVNVNDPAPVLSYCSSQGNSVSDEWIARVKVGTIDNTTGANGGYEDFTSLSTTLSAGSAYGITLTPGFSGNAYNEYWKIWIDLNQDGDFSDAGEEVYSSGGLSNTTVNGTLTVPSTAGALTTRMRVSMKYNGAPTACEAFDYGEVEDYTVTIVSNGNTNSAKVFETPEDAELSNNNPSFDLNVFPNPATDRVTFNVTNQAQSNLSISIFDMQGRVVYRLNNKMEQTQLSRSISVNDLPNGTYQVVVQNEKETRVEKLVVLH